MVKNEYLLLSVWFCLFGKLLVVAEISGVTESPTATERLLIHSFFNAINCKEASHPGKQTIALSPFRMIQTYALIRRLWKEPDCETGKEIDFSAFNVNAQSSWNVCSAGECRNKVCQCMKFVQGKHCTTFTGKCWLLFCKLTHCGDKAGPILHCSCDSSLSTTPVVTKHYWYDEGLETSFRPPPAGWKDKPFYYEIIGQHIVTLVSKTEKYYLKAEELAVKLIARANLKEMNAPVKKMTQKASLTTKLPKLPKSTKKTTPKSNAIDEIQVDYSDLTAEITSDSMKKPQPGASVEKVPKPTKKSVRKTTIIMVQKVIDLGQTTPPPKSNSTAVLIEKELPINTPPSYYFEKAKEESPEELNDEYEEMYETDSSLTTELNASVEHVNEESGAKSPFVSQYSILLSIVVFQCRNVITHIDSQ